jgi:effector protein LidA
MAEVNDVKQQQDSGLPIAKSEEETITLQHPSNRDDSVSLTSSELEEWFAMLQVSEMKEQAKHNPRDSTHSTASPAPKEAAPSPELAGEYLSHYGLKSAKDVITFLKSPTGKVVQALINKHLAEIALLKKNIQQELQDEKIRQYRMQAALILGLLHKKEAKARARHANDSMVAKQNIELQKNTVSADNTSAAYDAYTRSIDALQATLSDKIKQSELLEKEMEKLEKEEKRFNNRYQNFDNHLKSLDYFNEFVQAKDAISQSKVLEDMTQEIELLKHNVANKVLPPNIEVGSTEAEEYLKNLEERKNLLEEQQSFLSNGKSLSKTKLLETRIEGLTEKLNRQADEISDKLSQDQEEEARALLAKHNALHAEVAGLRDELSVLKGEKEKYLFQGSSVESFTESFIVEKGQSLVQKDGEYYLLKSGQDPEKFDSLSHEEKSTAKRDFARARPDIAVLKDLVTHNKELEGKEIVVKKNSVTPKADMLQSEILLITNQITQLQASRSALASAMSNPAQTLVANNTFTPPTPTPQPSKGAAPAVASTAQSLTQSYKHMVLLMKSNPTEQTIGRLRQMLTGPDGKIKPELNDVLSQIRVGRSISPALMTMLLKNMEQFGLSAYKPGVSPLKSPSPLKVVSPPEIPDKKTKSAAAPSPPSFSPNLRPKPR